MRYYNEILRFQEGSLSHHPSPEAVISDAPADYQGEVGERLAILADLNPPLAHRSREVRALVRDTYWHTSGSVVARMRRALAEANRHLVQENFKAPVGQKTAGSLTCAVFHNDEVFLGQVGAAYAFISHPDGRFEAFPRRNRLLIPLGGSVPPVIHIGYSMLEVDSVVLLATTPAAEIQAREQWRALLATTAPAALHEAMVAAMARGRVGGSLVFVRALPDPPPATTSKRRTFWPPVLPLGKTPPEPQTRVTPATAPGKAPAYNEQVMQMRQRLQALMQRPHITQPKPPAAVAAPQPPPQRKSPSLGARIAQWRIAWKRPRFAEGWSAKRIVAPLLPLAPTGVTAAAPRTIPAEKTMLTGGLALGLLLTVMLITLAIYIRFGGRERAQEMLTSAQTAFRVAYASQEPDDWKSLLQVTDQILTLDPQNVAAAELKSKAETALDALENAAVLEVRLLLDLGIAPTPRRMVVGGNWLYILNTATDEIIGLALTEDGVTSPTGAATSILKRGQSLYGAPVSHLVDLAWVDPSPTYPDGALFIYSEGGNFYIYEPMLGPASITHQQILGDLGAGVVTLMETFGERFYLVQRQQNQIYTYEPVHGIYENPRNYFAGSAAPELQQVLDIAIDGRVYLLMGNGTVRSYYTGGEDLSFEVSGLPDTDLRPIVIAIEPDPKTGLIYLGDAQHERIAVLDKRGVFLHQFRLPGKELQQLESLAIGESRSVLYIIAANRLYAAPLPDVIAH